MRWPGRGILISNVVPVRSLGSFFLSAMMGSSLSGGLRNEVRGSESRDLLKAPDGAHESGDLRLAIAAFSLKRFESTVVQFGQLDDDVGILNAFAVTLD